MYRRQPSRLAGAVASRSLPLFAALLLACSGSSGGSPAGAAPVVAGLTIWQPAAVGIGDGGGMASVPYGVTVADADADATDVVATVLDDAGTQVSEIVTTVPFAPGQTTGNVMSEFAVPTTSVMTYSVEVQAFDARGGASNVLRTSFAVVAGSGVPAIASLAPESVEAGTPGFTLSVTGTGFGPAAAVRWNGSTLTTTYVDATTLVAEVESYRLSSTGTAEITVWNPSPGGGTSAPASFVISPPAPRPAPTLAAIAPTSVEAGAAALTVTVTGSGFVPSSEVQWNRSWRSTTFVDAGTLRATLQRYDLESPLAASITVYTPAPGGGTSSAATFTVTRPPQAGVTPVALSANDVAWDPYQRRLYVSVPSTSPVNPNTVTVIDPFTGELTGSTYVGSEPDRISISEDGRYLYVGLRGASSVERLALPGLGHDLAIPLGRDAANGAYYANDLRVSPASPGTLAVARTTAGYSGASGGLVVFDDATARPTIAGAPGSYYPYDSLQWDAAGSSLYATSASYSSSLYAFGVDAAGVALRSTWSSAFASSGAIRLDRFTGLVYGDDGRAIDPATGQLVGTFAVSTAYGRRVVPDGSLGSAFFASGDSYGSGSDVTLAAFDLAEYVPTSTARIALVGAPARRPIRWGTDGIAFLTPDLVVVVRGPAVLPPSATTNPVPAIASLAPSSVGAGSPNLALAVTGTDFVRGATVLWNGSERSTTFVSATELVAYLPASDLAAAAPAEVTVANPSPGGGASTAAAFTVTP